MTSAMHAHRLDVVAAHVAASAPRSAIDLGCGPGELIERLVPMQCLERIVGIDESSQAFAIARERFLPAAPRVEIKQLSYTQPLTGLSGFDIATMVETIEHVDPSRLGMVADAVFGGLRPTRIFVTTPNRDYNPNLGLREGALRHPDHRFEWGRQRFRRWAHQLAAQFGYRATFFDIGDIDPQLGAPTQMARFDQDS